MADDSYLGSLLGWLKGEPAQTPVKETLAPPMLNYPSVGDAANARHYGFSDGNINQQYLDNQKARVMGHDLDVSGLSPKGKPVKSNVSFFMPSSADGMTITQAAESASNPKLSKVVDLKADPQPTVNDLAMRGALAANRIPVAAVGFDPSVTTLDTRIGSNATIGGAYSPFKDTIYSNADYPSNVVHESIHRGMEKLRQNYPDKMKTISQNLPSEEMVVRWLMKSQAGDPEFNYTGNVGQQQRRDAGNMFDQKQYPNIAGNYQKAVDQMQELAIQEMKNRGKRAGPQ